MLPLLRVIAYFIVGPRRAVGRDSAWRRVGAGRHGSAAQCRLDLAPDGKARSRRRQRRTERATSSNGEIRHDGPRATADRPKRDPPRVGARRACPCRALCGRELCALLDGEQRPVEVEVTNPIRTHAIFPAERVASSRTTGTILAFDLPTPASVVVWIDQLAPLFILPDPMDDDAPVHGLPHVLDVTDFGADPSGRSLATTALQAAIDRATDLGGGGTVVLPRGVYRSGTLMLKEQRLPLPRTRRPPSGFI